MPAAWDARGVRVDATDSAEVQPVDELATWPAFAESVRERLEAGRAEYGDKSFERPPGELLAELQCEALDLAGWGFILFERIERMRRRGP